MEINGKEHGGQLVRNTVITVAMAFITGTLKDKIVRIVDVRGARPEGKRGMKHSLFGAIHFIQEIISNIKIDGLVDGSPVLELDFTNAVIADKIPEEIIIDAVGSGSAWLLFLAVHPMMIFLSYTKKWSGTVKISGGTDVWGGGAKRTDTLTPPTEFVRDVTMPNVSHVGHTITTVDVTITRSVKDVGKAIAAGTYPIVVYVKPIDGASSIQMSITDPFRPERGNPDAVIKTGQSTTSPFIVGISHPSSKYRLPELDTTQYADVRFADQYILYWTAAKLMGCKYVPIEPLIAMPDKDDHLVGAIMVLDAFGLMPLD